VKEELKKLLSRRIVELEAQRRILVSKRTDLKRQMESADRQIKEIDEESTFLGNALKETKS
jgi:hypothetical protein